MRCEVDGRWLLNFCSNDYLGLSQQFAVVNALQDGAAREGVGSTASHLVCGHHAVHDELERELAEWIGAPRALLFGSGFLANLAVVQALLGDDDLCVQDRLKDRKSTSELQSLMRISYAVFCLKKKNTNKNSTLIQII